MIAFPPCSRYTGCTMTQHQQRFLLPAQYFEAAYLSLHRSGELQRRADAALASLTECRVCPRACLADRLAGETGTCGCGRQAVVSSHFPHMGEEDPLRGWRGSGTIFLEHCSLRCVFCQNFDISQAGRGAGTSAEQLAAIMLQLQRAGCHNINWVTPSHVVPQLLQALVLAVDGGLTLPIVYNTSGYDALHTLRWLDGVVDIYMPDFKIWDTDHARRFLTARDYPDVARTAFKEMQRQVGVLHLDESGLAKRGLLVRHLVMPGGIAGTPDIMRFLAEEISPDTYVNLMAQYRPAGRVGGGHYPEIDRSITAVEMDAAYQAARDAGLWRFDERRRMVLSF